MSQRRGPEQEIDPSLLLRAYAMGVFPMADHRDDPSIYWVEPKMRGVLPLDGFHLSRSLRKTIASERFEVTVDRDFAGVIRLCAEAAQDRPETWINGPIERAFLELHRQGYAHSIECWQNGALAGGLYGLALGRAFFGESMVTRVRDASKVAFAHLVARLQAGGFRLLDCQFITDHLASLGAVEIPRADYVALLGEALDGASSAGEGSASGDFFALDGTADDAGTVSGPLSRKVIAQLLGQIS
ncbi:leucyl/phenylalanyl-tRNA--protein transferase [Sphingomonas pokkalii]|uniref:Leucyl/phenylalanyl-tRNA--protein transferase n=1 Tax=Sphingomonas pokkalii TaxID=2175090 RepID=A0A2U0SFC9_9SPHN|nr:leucyl/phenylalanyl-tRNA--protein transferase [Sphingomonas pokkalii]PVX30067.1 leucyl/phenylalanyl-tRNA--protein transferase [Sphingomonas pokkalii]